MQRINLNRIKSNNQHWQNVLLKFHFVCIQYKYLLKNCLMHTDWLFKLIQTIINLIILKQIVCNFNIEFCNAFTYFMTMDDNLPYGTWIEAILDDENGWVTFKFNPYLKFQNMFSYDSILINNFNIHLQTFRWLEMRRII